ncbi:glycosyltransferase [Hymenobacter terricola]|uniref:glycosyltransferase n=1 Tax=Hymenobacter terricola TaxID=2819236 RepID=UPI001B30E2DD|nr:glycosyltransferase [Hymenobacter terricola]
MTLPEFSVLLLAWDDADPNVVVLGGSALLPTLPLVYQMAAQQPVLAVYPHLPPGEATGPGRAAIIPQAAPAPTAEPTTGPKTTITEAATPPQAPIGALDTAVAMPGVRLLPSPAAVAKTMAVPQPTSRLVGLDDLTPVSPAPLQTARRPPVASLRSQPAAAARSQWPTGKHAPPTASWQAPAAPYAGSAEARYFPPPPPAPPRPAGFTEPVAAGLATQTQPAALPVRPRSATILRPNGRPQAGDLRFDPDPELPRVHHPEAFDEPTEEVGPAEANDISAPEDDLLPDEPAPAPEAPVAVAPAVPAPVPTPVPAAEPAAPVVRKPAPEGLNFRMIQYARRAAQLVQGRADFGVIYAPNWPAWLAALEIRNSSGQPLVLYAASLAADLPDPAEHGWQLEMERMTMRRATLILVPDVAVRRRLHQLYGNAIGEVRVVAATDEDAVQRVLREVAIW